MERPYQIGCNHCKVKSKFNHMIDEKQSLIESEQRKFANEFREKYGDECWSEQEVEYFAQNK